MKDLDVYNEVAVKNSSLAQRLSCFSKTEKEHVPSGLFETRSAAQTRNLRCCACESLFFHPITFSKCHHSLCPHCII